MKTTGEGMEVMAPSEEEVEAARALEARLSSSPGSQVDVVFNVEGEEHVLPPRAAGFFRAFIRELARGHRVGLVDLDGELTTTEAAELLGVSRPTLVGLLKQDRIPHRMVGTHRRVPRGALIEYKNQYAPAGRRTVEERLRATDELLGQWHAAEDSEAS